MDEAEKNQKINEAVGFRLEHYLSHCGAVVLSSSVAVSTWISRLKTALPPGQVYRVVKAKGSQYLVTAVLESWPDGIGATIHHYTYHARNVRSNKPLHGQIQIPEFFKPLH